MATFQLITELNCSSVNEVELENVEQWSDIEEWYIKWDTLHYTLDGETWYEVSLESDPLADTIDWKRPKYMEVRDVLEPNQEPSLIMTVDGCHATREMLK